MRWNVAEGRRYLMMVAVCLVGLSPVLAADSPVAVFGYPVGGRLSAPMRVCTIDELTTNHKSLCWVDKPFVSSDGSKMGTVDLPNPDSLPAWAAYASFRMQFDKSGLLEVITVRDQEGDIYLSAQQISKSIISRFGQPTSADLRRGRKPQVAVWTRNDIHIVMQCYSNCEVKFWSPAAQAKYDKEMAERTKVEKARPQSP